MVALRRKSLKGGQFTLKNAQEDPQDKKSPTAGGRPTSFDCIDNELILGLDFMKLMDCQIDVGQETMVIQGRAIKPDSLGYVGCSRVIAKEMVQVPPRSEAIIQGKMVESTLGNSRIEPSDNFLKKGNAMVAKTLPYSQNTVPVCLMNISDEMYISCDKHSKCMLYC